VAEFEDPFREGLPDFGDPALNVARDDFVKGAELWKALSEMDSLATLVAAINALDEADVRRALLTTLVVKWTREGKPL
jgi:hypothetical protein